MNAFADMETTMLVGQKYVAYRGLRSPGETQAIADSARVYGPQSMDEHYLRTNNTVSHPGGLSLSWTWKQPEVRSVILILYEKCFRMTFRADLSFFPTL